MKVLVLGTSNTILKGGWLFGFRDGIGDQVEIVNRSVGASPSTQFSRWCAQDLSEYDFVIFDAIVNDENLLKHVGSLSFLRDILEDMLSSIAHQSNLIVLGFCNERFLFRRSKVYRLYEEVCADVGGTFLSVVDFALDYAGPRYRDPAHLSLPIAFDFGSHLAGLLPGFKASRNRPRNKRYNFRAIHASQVFGMTSEVRKNSLISEKFVALRQLDGGEISENLPLVGFEINSCETYGFARVTCADGQKSRVLSLRYRQDSRRILLKFIPLKGGFLASHFHCVHGGAEPIGSPHEEILASHDGDSQISISWLSFWSR